MDHTLVNLPVHCPSQAFRGPKSGSGVLGHQNGPATQQRLHLLDFAFGVVELVVVEELRVALLHTLKAATLDEDELPSHLTHSRYRRVGPYSVSVLGHHLLDHL